MSLAPPVGERDPYRAGGADRFGAGPAQADRHGEGGNRTTAC